jgi:hypothetical protein
VEFTEVVDVGVMVLSVLLEEKMVVGVVVLGVLVVGSEEEMGVDLLVGSEEITVGSDDEAGRDEEGRTLDLMVGSEEAGDVGLLLGCDEGTADEREDAIAVAVATAVGTASTVNLSAVMPQQEQAEE